jgi:hypothetical protein
MRVIVLVSLFSARGRTALQLLFHVVPTTVVAFIVLWYEVLYLQCIAVSVPYYTMSHRVNCFRFAIIFKFFASAVETDDIRSAVSSLHTFTVIVGSVGRVAQSV